MKLWYFLLLLSFVTTPSQATNGDIVACIDDHPPYQHIGDKPHGTHITALEQLASLLDKKLTFIQSTSFARCAVLLKDGNVDVIAGFNKNPERSKYAFYAPFKVADERIIITRSDTNVSSYDDLKGLIIGVPRGTTYFKRFDEDNTLNKVDIHNPRTGIELIRKKRIDAILSSPYLKQSLLSDIEAASLKTSLITPDLYEEAYTHFGFSNKNKLGMSQREIQSKVLAAFNAGYFNQ